MRFWADELAEAVERRHKAPYVVADWKTPSGTIHVGALRGVVLHDAVARMLRSRGHEVRYIYGFDDFDPFDKVPSYLDAAYEQYLGVPISGVPAPLPDGTPNPEPVTPEHNYGWHYGDEFESVYRSLGVESESLRTSLLYPAGEFDKAIRLVLDSGPAVRAAYGAAVTDRSADRTTKELVPAFALNVRCQGCGKIATTRVTAWDGNEVQYECRDDVAPFASGCGYRGSVSPFGGTAKLPWKIEWAAKWFTFHVDVEGAGKDHYTKGGSRDVAREVFQRVFADHAQLGYQIVPEDLFYEWFYVGGAKMSTSMGIGQSAVSVAEQIPAELLRLLMIRTRPRTAVNYEETPDAIPDLYDEYDRLLVAYRAAPQGQDSAIFSMVRLRNNGELSEYVMRFRKVIALVEQDRLTKEDSLHEQAKEDKQSPLTDAETTELKHRAVVAARWLEQYGQPSRPIELTEQQKQFILTFARCLEGLDTWEAEAIQSRIYDAKTEVRLSSQPAFRAIYGALLGAESGPQAGHLIASRSKAEVLQMLRKTVE